ncbi:MAG: site-2 protease family protein [Candidatus Eremiobacteraeota bacterium]|nr:site-2 protease family protein [Candidatus Eremiobacteraeota bacterium]
MLDIIHFIIGILAAVFSIGLIIFVHELGHFMAARRYGVAVNEFSLGFGPLLWSKQVKDTKYCLRLFPLGGFVSIKGEDGTNDDPDDQTNFQNKSLWQKVVILAGGPLMNYVIAIILFLVVGMFFGVMTMHGITSPRVSKVMKGMPAEKAGFKKGDIIASVDGIPVKDGIQMVELINARPGQQVDIGVRRGDEVLEFTLTTDAVKDEYSGETIGLIGIRPTLLIDLNFKKIGILEAIYWSIEQTAFWTYAPFKIVGAMVSKQVSAKAVAENLMGPIGIAHFIFEVVERGFAPLLYICALVSVSLGILNLLPIPALDGMRIFILVIGAVIGKTIDPEKENIVHTVGFYVLLFLIILITKQDVIRIIEGTHYFK